MSRPALGLSFGSVAADYARGRPGWPPQAVDVVGLTPSARVLDLAAGTGKLTELLLSRFAHVVAVEPDDGMRAANPSPDARAGTAEAIPLETSSVEAVFVAEAFHWFCDPPALREIARVLRPGGTLVLLWTRTRRSLEELTGVHELMERLRNEAGVSSKTNRYFSGEWRDVFAGAPFGPLESAVFEYEHVLDRDRLVSYFMSQSQVASRSAEERREIRAELGRLIPDGRHVRSLAAEVHWTTLRRRGAAPPVARPRPPS